MRHFFVTLVFGALSVMSTFAQQKSLATVYKSNGLWVFTDCEPIEKYEVVEREKSVISFVSGQYTAIRDKLIKRSVKDVPDADAVLLSFVNEGVDRAAVLKFSSEVEQSKIALGNVHMINGVYVFTDSEPVSKYIVLGRVKSVIGWSEQYSYLRDKLIRKALKEYPDAEGVILSFVNGGVDRAVVIKFKE